MEKIIETLNQIITPIMGASYFAYILYLIFFNRIKLFQNMLFFYFVGLNYS
jgi:hypothetical protein